MEALTPLDQPDDIVISCGICNKPLRSRYHWVYDRWLHGTVHDKCAEEWSRAEKTRGNAPPSAQPIPERFAEYRSDLANQQALSLAQGFAADSELHTLAIIGPPGRGKSRLAWAVIQQYFDDLAALTGAHRWVDYYLFGDLVTDPERSMLSKVKIGRYVFIDDIGACECYGRDRATLQAIIRTRIQKSQWTWLTIDNISFDPDLDHVMDGRAVKVWIT
jgi:hypothetical protein